VSALSLTVGAVRLTRVGYADVPIDPARAGLTPEQVEAVEWREPTWAQGRELLAGAAAWIIESGDARIVVDPAQAADEIIRTDADAAFHQDAFAAVLADAGFPRETITHDVATHLEGVGMHAWRNDDGTWSRFFANAPILVLQRELDAIDHEGWVADRTGVIDQLRAAGAIVGLPGDRAEITDAVALEFTGAHTPGHAVVRIDSEGERAVMVGHLAVNPLHLVTGECPQQHPDPARAEAVLTALRDQRDLLIGPLWPAPGAGRWNGDAFVPVTSR
jgi:glyoxylase-like metal-dependent hydrolase (beta-lactamase superfamily II)